MSKSLMVRGYEILEELHKLGLLDSKAEAEFQALKLKLEKEALRKQEAEESAKNYGP